MRTSVRLPTLLAAGLLGVALAAPHSANAISTNDPTPPSSSSSSQKPADPPKATTAKKKKPGKKEEKKSEQQFRDGYKAAYAMIYDKHDYVGGIAQLKSLGHDDHADVANLIGYSSRKLGRYDDAKTWYEKALAADPQHARTWSYYGMWHAEQGNKLKAKEHLTKVAELCGNTSCRDYVALKGVIEGTRTY